MFKTHCQGYIAYWDKLQQLSTTLFIKDTVSTRDSCGFLYKDQNATQSTVSKNINVTTHYIISSAVSSFYVIFSMHDSFMMSIWNYEILNQDYKAYLKMAIKLNAIKKMQLSLNNINGRNSRWNFRLLQKYWQNYDIFSWNAVYATYILRNVHITHRIISHLISSHMTLFHPSTEMKSAM